MIKCGFFDAIDKDRLYTAEDMNNVYNPLISDGIYRYGDNDKSFLCSVNGLTVSVQGGKGKFFGHFVYSDEVVELPESYANSGYHRMDSVIVKVDTSEEVRGCEFYIKRGDEVLDDVEAPAPELEETTTLKEYRLCNIMADDSTFTLYDKRGTDECPYVSNLLWESKSANTVKTKSYKIEGYMNAGEGFAFDIPHDMTADVLTVHKNGLLLVEGEDYEISMNNFVKFYGECFNGTEITFTVYKNGRIE